MAFVLELECGNKSDVHMLSCVWEQETEWLSHALKIILKQELSNVCKQIVKSKAQISSLRAQIQLIFPPWHHLGNFVAVFILICLYLLISLSLDYKVIKVPFGSAVTD